MRSPAQTTEHIATGSDGAKLIFDSAAPAWTLHYEASDNALSLARETHGKNWAGGRRRILLVSGNAKSDLLAVHPLVTSPTNSRFLQPKYFRVRTITFDGFELGKPASVANVLDALQELPAGFVKDPYYGLGMRRELSEIVRKIETISTVSEIRIKNDYSSDVEPSLTGNCYTLSSDDFDAIRRKMARIHKKAVKIANDDKAVVIHNNLLTPIDEKRFPEVHRPYRKDSVIDAIGKGRTVALSGADRGAVVEAAKSAVRPLQKSKPEVLLELTREIEVVTLEALIDRLKEMLKGKLSEPKWQRFFLDNGFVLRIAFALPLMMVGGQVTMGGGRLDGSGDKVADYLLKSPGTGNLTIVEIKTPDTPLVEPRAYRGGVHAPSRELTRAVNQLLDQRYQLQKSLPGLKDSSGMYDLESYAIQGLVIAGRLPEGGERLKSLELFRNSLKSVVVTAYDELVQKLEHLLELLRSAPT